MKVAAYVRVSTGHQSLEMQKDSIRRYLEYRGWGEPTWFEDVGSGTNGKRAGFKDLMNRCGEFDTVISFKLDRIFRDLRELLNTLEELDSRGVQFISIQDSIDLSTPAGRAMMQMIGVFGEFEAATTRERVKAGVRAAIDRKGSWGPERQVDYDAIREAKRQHGWSQRKLAKHFSVSQATVNKCLKTA